MKKPPSAKAKAAKAKREKITGNVTSGDVRERIEESYDRTWKRDGPGDLMEASYPGNKSIHDFLTAEEARAQEEKILGRRPACLDAVRVRSDAELDDDVPDFLHTAAKAGPPSFPSDTPVLDHLGRTPKERKERKIMDAIALGEKVHPASTNALVVGGKTIDLNKRVITLMKDHDLQYPDLYMAVYVAGDWAVPDDEARFARLFSRCGCYKADTVEEADLVVFGGGSDVEPSLYGEDNANMHESVYFSKDRDNADMKIYTKALELGIPMMGVCRGAQFLHVMNGGKLYQDVNGHNGAHKAFCLREKMLIENVSSVHHQQCMFNKEMEVLMTTSTVCTTRHIDKDKTDKRPRLDVEAFFYRDTGCFGVQGHPEYANYNRFSVWCMETVSNLFLTSPDFTWEGKRLRMTKEARDAKAIAAAYIENAYNQTKEV
jgi:GMP synthase-like glutamine amidotransferase